MKLMKAFEVGFLGLALLAPDMAQSACIDIGSHFNWVSALRTEEYPRYHDFTVDNSVVWAVGSQPGLPVGSKRLDVFDVSDPAFPSLLASHDLPGTGSHIVSDNGIGLLEISGGKTLVLELADPMQLAVTDSLDSGGRLLNVAFCRDSMYDLAYLATGTTGLQIVDLSTPTDVVTVGSWRPGEEVRAVQLYGDQAFVLAAGQLFTLDITDRFNPVATDSVASDAYRMIIDGSTLVVPGLIHDLKLYDLAPGQAPVFTSEFVVPWMVQWLVLVDGLLAVSYDSEMKFYEVVASDSLIERGSFRYESNVTSGRLVASGGLFFHTSSWGISVHDVGDGTFAKAGDLMLAPSGPEGLASKGNFAYLAADDSGLIVYDMSAPTTPLVVGSASVDGDVHDVIVAQDFVYALSFETLAVFDVSDPTLPQRVGELEGFGGYKFGNVADNVIWGYTGTDGDIFGLDVSDPTAPVVETWIDRSGWVSGVVAAEGLLHVLGYYGQYEIYSLTTDPPTLLSVTNPNNYGKSLAVRGDVALLGSSTGIWFVDVSDPVVPEVVNVFPMSSYAMAISLHGNRAVVSTLCGLLTLDISDMQYPRNLGTTHGSYEDHVALANGSFLTWSSYYALVPNKRIRGVPTSCEFVSGVNFEIPKLIANLEIYPNPFNPHTTISFELGGSKFVPVDLRISDLRGRKVKTIYSRKMLGPGIHNVPWAGDDKHGRRLASGVYLVQIVTPEVTETVKTVLIK